MTYEPVGEAAFRQRLLTSPGERREVDYKASMPFGTDDSFSLKLLRHIQGMANAGGGWLVIGFAETTDHGLVPDPAHTDDIHATYDPTRLSQAADSYVARGQRMQLTVYPEDHADTGLRYPVIQVEGFERVPYVCRSDKAASDTEEQILVQGMVYVRRPSAETAPVSTPSDWEEIISRCVGMRRDEFLVEFRQLFERMTSSSAAEPSAAEQLSEWTGRMRARAIGQAQDPS